MASSTRKPDADEIIAFVDELSGQSWLDSRKRVWPHFIYHFNDIRNIAGVLKSGVLLSRQQCRDRGIEFVDVADREVIGSSAWTKDYVRFYFRPHTPTQYHQEGIRPPAYRRHEAHCPVPVFLLFDSRRLLSRAGVEFTDGNFGASGHSGGIGRHSSASALRAIPFRTVYHDEAFSPAAGSTITYHRHAEVLARDEIDLAELEQVVCRSAAERDTLLTLLGEEANAWKDRVRLETPGERLYYRQWLYVDQVQLLGNQILVRFRLPSQRPIPPFTVRVQVWSQPDGTLLKEKAGAVTNMPESLRIGLDGPAEQVLFRFEIEGALAYQGSLSSRSLF